VEKEKRAKEQTYNILFNLLNESEQTHVRELEKALQLEKNKKEMKAVASTVASTLTVLAPHLLTEYNLKKVVKYIYFFLPTLDEELKEEVVSCLFPNLDRKEIVKALKSRNKYIS